MSALDDLRLGDIAAPLFAFWLAALIVAPFGQREVTNVGGAPRSEVVATVMLHGTAATGSAIGEAMVTVTSATGQRRRTTTDPSGKFSIEVADAAPYILVVHDARGDTWYSYAAGPGVVNITPLTTLALLDAHGNVPLDVLANNWAQSRLNVQQVLSATRKVNAHLQPLMQEVLGNASQPNFFTAAFDANHRGIDAVLDRLRVTTGCGEGTHCRPAIHDPNGDVLTRWNTEIPTAGIQTEWPGGATTAETPAGTAPEKTAGAELDRASNS